MGYYTRFYGEIHITDLTYKVLQKLLKEDSKEQIIQDLQYLESEQLLYVEKRHIVFDFEIKNYDNLMENICQLIAEIDKQNHGEIKCYGESEEDLWRIIVKNGRAIVQRGYIKYYGNGRFLNPDVRKITKNFKGKKLSAWLL